jgi:hypothetical protein
MYTQTSNAGFLWRQSLAHWLSLRLSSASNRGRSGCRQPAPLVGLPFSLPLIDWYPLAHCVTPLRHSKIKRKTYRFCHVSDTRKTAYAGK